MKRLLFTFGCAVALSLGVMSCSNNATGPVEVADQAVNLPPFIGPRAPVYVEGSYVVVLKDANTLKQAPTVQRVAARGAQVQSFAAARNISLENTYDAVFPGFSASMSADQAEALRADPQVERVERDQEMFAVGQVLPAGIDRVDADISSTVAGNGAGTVSGVEVFIIDTGIDPTNKDLNVVELKSFVQGVRSGADDNGHGTHVSGTIGARDNTSAVVGIAPGVDLHAIKVLNRQGSGTMSAIIAGINYVTNYKLSHPDVPCVANMSLGGYAGSTAYNAMDNAVASSIGAGVTYCIAAGNSTDDASLYTPAHVATAITVGAYDATKTGGAYANTWASFSNYGPTVDLLGPGVNVVSTYLKNRLATMSGTSMATPHVTGSAALYLSHNPTSNPGAVYNALIAAATNGANGAITKVPAQTTTTSVYAGTF